MIPMTSEEICWMSACNIADLIRRQEKTAIEITEIFIEKIEKVNLSWADDIIVISNILQDYFIKQGVPKEKLHVIHNGADPDKFKPMPFNKGLATKWNIDEDSVVIGWVGSLFGWSGLQNLITMARHVIAERQNVKLLFVGGGKNKGIIEEAFLDSPDKVATPGTVPFDHVPDFLSLMDIVIVIGLLVYLIHEII